MLQAYVGLDSLLIPTLTSITNHVNADTLSRILLDFDTYMETCTEEVSPDVIQAITCLAQLQDHRGSNWMTALTDNTTVLILDSTPMKQPHTPQIQEV